MHGLDLPGGTGCLDRTDATAAVIRHARPEERAVVAALHTESWRRTYRGLLADSYLDGPLVEDKQADWAAKFHDSASGRSAVLVAELDGKVLGFIRMVLDADPVWGVYIDNLHVSPEAHGLGLGRRLFLAGAAWGAKHRPEDRLFLYVYADNQAARRTYARWQGREVELFTEEAPGGGEISTVRVAWESCAAVAAEAR